MRRNGVAWLIVLALSVMLVSCIPQKPRPAYEPVDLTPKLTSGNMVQKAKVFEVILDNSQSMTREYNGRSKFELARDLAYEFNETIPEMPLTSALRTFGRGPNTMATGTFLLQSPSEYSKGEFAGTLDTVEWAGGGSPLASAINGANRDLEATEGEIALVIFSDGIEMDDSPVRAAEALKEKYGDRLCIYTVVVGNAITGIDLLKKVAEAGKCGSTITDPELMTTAAMGDFVESIFLTIPPDTDGDGVYDYKDECPDTPKGVKVDEKGCPIDTDGDGVADYLDKCPDTPKGVKVDEKGCPFDTDGDGVYDYMDECPDTPKGVAVNEKGCPFDTDGDGVYDYLDACPDTPKGVAVDEKGCPFDTDGDGVYDYLDACPDTPKGVAVDEKGCPFDTDGDGVYDYLDDCPDTPAGVRVDEKGCPFDTDGDGVYDYLDKCPDTPSGVKVDEKGCPLDTDGDGVYDYLDKCPGTPKGVKVDDNGCPLDTDGDGVYDYLDECPDTPKGARVTSKGCWTLSHVLFGFNKAEIKPGAYPFLDEVVDILEKNPSMKVEIQGHTDNVGSKKFNEELSKKRADAVADYLREKGISGSRMYTEAYWFSKPVATNGTDEGRALNRRVELHPVK